MDELAILCGNMGGKKVMLRRGAGAVRGAETAALYSIFDRMHNIICRLGLHLHVQ